MENIVRTVYGSLLQTCLLLGIPLPVAPNSSLNTKFGVQENVAIQTTDRPKMKYVAIGNGGHDMITGTNGITVPQVIQHDPEDAALFKHLPFVLRALTNDLTASERANYAMRTIVTISGTPYVAYYLKRLDFSAVTAGMNLKTVSNGTTTTTAFVPNGSNLNPTPPDLSNNGVLVASGNYVAATAKIPFTLNEADIIEIQNVANIMYGDSQYAIISEVALVSGVDKTISVTPSIGGIFNFNEVIAAQVVSFISNFFPLKFSNGSVDIALDVGATEPLFTVQTAL